MFVSIQECFSVLACKQVLSVQPQRKCMVLLGLVIVINTELLHVVLSNSSWKKALLLRTLYYVDSKIIIIIKKTCEYLLYGHLSNLCFAIDEVIWEQDSDYKNECISITETNIKIAYIKGIAKDIKCIVFEGIK